MPHPASLPPPDAPTRTTRRACLAQALALCGALPPLARAQAPSGAKAGQRAVVLNLSLAPDSLDPTMAAAAAVGEVVHYNVLEGLTRIEESGRVVPLLADSWRQGRDGLSYVFRLREGMRFHDGSPLDAQAVRFSFERAQAPGSTNKSRRALFDNIAAIATPDAHTVALTLHHPDVDLPFRLGEGPAVIVHPASAGQLAHAPVGTGPYRVAQWLRGHSIRLERAPHARAGASQARPDGAWFRFMSDPQQRDEALRSGDIDLFFQFATNTARRFQDDVRYQMLLGESGGKGMLALNHRRAPLGDVRVRRAITHAIDREEFIQRVLDGHGSAIGSHFAPTDRGFLHLDSLYPHDPQRARALLREAGVRTPLRLKLALPPAPYAHLGGDVLARQLAQVGIVAELQRLSWSEWLQGPFRGHFDMTLINHVEPLDYLIYTDPDYYFGYDSPAFRVLAHEHALATSPRQRQQLFGQLQRHLAQDAANAWIFTPSLVTVVRKGLRGAWMNYPIFAHDVGAMWWD
ncbi:peptide/nickel transport system substrate-binding protein [Oryzisolibacter propanilivorax]|uniref:Peptide/nickel transport system substrate-binding protein n=1 Tax=Oryzisolibacter propanilivorax TaxID=1527607 RepID=A0A1G9VI85_9BURK|nr:ABC transporter substrate-binding protein [Oryzisolibacter propanilivorax]SDM71869.1 peptide/nickel transport system substrate-binding protein [Oryzisolibacter propanilivorax]